MLRRYDSAPVPKISIDPQTGYLHAKNVPIARVGVFPYMRADGSVAMEAKLPQELLDDSTVESANDKPITDNHPNGLVNVNNSHELAKGLTASNAHEENGTIKVDMTITDPHLIRQVQDSQNGKQELSIGFETEVEPVKGSYEGMKYDSVQKNIRINHVAVVKRGRAGHSVRITGDSAEQLPPDYMKENNSMEFTTVRVDDADIKVAKEDAGKATDTQSKIESYKKQIADLQAKIKELEGKNGATKAEADNNAKDAEKQKAKADALEKELAGYREKEEKSQLDSLAKKAKAYLGDSYDLEGKTARDIKLDAIKSQNKDFKADGLDDSFIDGYFNAMMQKPSVVGYTGSSAGGDIEKSMKNDGSDAMAKAIHARQSLYKGGNN